MNEEPAPRITIARFESGDIDPKQFNHELHVYIGWLYVSEFGLCGALARFDAALKRLVSKLGAESKYHTTLTWFFLVLIAERLEEDESWSEFKRRNSDLISDSKGVLSRYYSDEYLFSNRARERFVLPDNLLNAERCA